MADVNDDRQADDADLQRVLRAAGRRTQPADDLARAVRDAVHAEWRATVAARRTRRRRWSGLVAAASVTVVAVAIWLSRPALDVSPVSVASMVRVAGEVRFSGDGVWSRWQRVRAHQALQAGEELMTGPGGYAAVALLDGVSVRLDQSTRVRLANEHQLVVREGAVYVDTHHERAGGERLQIVTPAGTVRHVGTQYEVRLLGSDVRIRVRAGRIELTQESGVSRRGEAGEQLTVFAGGRIERAATATYGPQWSWIGNAAPPFEIHGRPLVEFLTWAARELGREIVFRTPQSEQEATRVVLSGSVEGLAPDEALTAVLSTTPLRGTLRDGQLVIELESPAR